MMVGKFLNLDDDTPPIGQGLKRKPKRPLQTVDRDAIAETGKAHGFDRTTATPPSREPPVPQPRRGRPPLNEEMTYWRIYVSPTLRDDLNRLRDQEGRRLNDLLADMLDAYKAQKP